MTELLAADIGATNSRFALFSLNTAPDGALALALKREIRLSGKEYPSFGHVLRALMAGPEPFLRPGGAKSAVLALAGPVEGDTCRLSNLPWLSRARDVRTILEIPSVALINDFSAQGRYCLFPEINGAAVIQAGSPLWDHPSAVIGAGTGLGKAILLSPAPPADQAPEHWQSEPAPDAGGETRLLPASLLARAAASRILPSEGGHAEFPFLAEEEGFAAFLRRETGQARPIGDMVVSGPGLGHLHAYLTGLRLPDAEASQKALFNPEILDWFARLYARACRNFVLETLALRGLFITGGMALRLPVLTRPAFLKEFRHSSAHGGLLERLPVRHLQDPRSGLWGAALSGTVRLAASLFQS
jgi:glucokinase